MLNLAATSFRAVSIQGDKNKLKYSTKEITMWVFLKEWTAIGGFPSNLNSSRILLKYLGYLARALLLEYVHASTRNTVSSNGVDFNNE